MLNYYSYEHPVSNQWVTFVHGAGGSSAIWYKQVREFKKHFNVLILDLRGHGDSKSILKTPFQKKYTFDAITDDILEVINHLKITKSHFVGISLGTILIRNLAEKKPDLVKSMIMGGAIIKLNLRSRFLIFAGNLCKSIVPYMLLYKLFAFVIMPNKNHEKSRLLFVNEAKKLYQKEFLRWFKLTSEINPLLRLFRMNDLKIPTLYIMGEEDYLFLPSIKNIVEKHLKASLVIVEKCGHVVNVEKATIFNNKTIQYINSIT
ncbi:alpha/beta hydrolase [Tenacibaculum dicentrarchi]|nr:alpha/beta hydrolase [Tenacibaculum dicentrarchi]MCD8414500.1 alpha/beta hydrolase [Tenacibaculum dicentrarchi]MCD8419981.1 alpha/beta hydrolase [Tenacibaculum dicentrarchi]MCD8437007.1 alpha/beta hydrolase [Tenacibaculum dicentrarchi]MCD8449387.1 alpha/beta hydrolase [Tenacibaculum dicentrarchi]